MPAAEEWAGRWMVADVGIDIPEAVAMAVQGTAIVVGFVLVTATIHRRAARGFARVEDIRRLAWFIRMAGWVFAVVMATSVVLPALNTSHAAGEAEADGLVGHVGALVCLVCGYAGPMVYLHSILNSALSRAGPARQGVPALDMLEFRRLTRGWTWLHRVIARVRGTTLERMVTEPKEGGGATDETS
jgi:hypothetical protein